MASKSRPASSAPAGRPLSVKATQAEVDVWKSVFVLIFLLPDTFDRCVPQPRSSSRQPPASPMKVKASQATNRRGLQSILKSLPAKRDP